MNWKKTGIPPDDSQVVGPMFANLHTLPKDICKQFARKLLCKNSLQSGICYVQSCANVCKCACKDQACQMTSCWAVCKWSAQQHCLARNIRNFGNIFFRNFGYFGNMRYLHKKRVTSRIPPLQTSM